MASMQELFKGTLAEWRAMFTPARPFESADTEAAYLAAYSQRFAGQRRAVIILGALSWIAFLGWDVLHAAQSAGVAAVLPELIVWRVVGFLVLAGVAVASHAPWFSLDEHRATVLLIGGNVAVYAVGYVMMLLVPLQYAHLYYHYALLLSMVFAFGVLRLRAVPILWLMALYGIGGTALMHLQWLLSSEPGAAAYAIGAWKLSNMQLSIGVVGCAFGIQLERTQRAQFRRERDLAAAHQAALAHSREVESLNAAIRHNSRQAEEKARALVALKEQMRLDAEHRNREKSRFLASAVHDLKQPLQAIGNTLEPAMTLLQRGDAAAAGDMLALAHTAVTLMRGQLSALLEISRLESGYASAEPSHFDLLRLIDETVLQFRDEADRLGVRLEVERGDEAELVVLSDRHFLGRILQNLVSNGLKYRQPGRAEACRVGVRVARASGAVRLVVEDNGIGIARDDLAPGRLFTPFFRAEAERARSDHGVGLGLSIVAAMLALMPDHGMTLDSAPGVGSRFVLDIPPGDAAAVVESLPDTAVGPGLDALQGAYLVVLDDDPLVRESTVALLASRGVLHEAAGSHQEFERLLSQLERAPDAVLSDHRLPEGRTAWDVQATLAQLHPDVPLLVFTGEDLSEEAASKAGFRALLRKPVSPERLLATVAQVLSARTPVG